MRAKLLRLAEQEYVLILNFHHIVCDGSSLIIFYQELAALYEAFLEGRIRICLHCPFNTPTIPLGSMRGFKEKSWNLSLPIGNGNSARN